MLKVYGNAYSDNADNFKEVVKALEAGGFQVAYNFENSGTIIKDVVSLTENDDESENESV